ncbi:uncharacterized protein IUM83_02063 [Phytophthora cinnamomi]|uniref:uncharacterized protein n=1 Tax=Phytophthora cinnamomi TaxID=4785 RepID=UPI003559927B|nr:hypothetical protein IUM83_02063 [Phytophthora cinnamomi]
MNEVLRLRTEMQQEHRRMMAVMRRIALQPVVRTLTEGSEVSDVTAGVGAVRRVVRLAKRPRDLFQLWHEYEFGLNGTKPAKEFTRAERGANKFAYSRRKAFWDSVAYLVRAGLTSDVAIDRIYAAYGRQRPVTAILTALRRDKKNGGHPALRV